MQSRSHAFSLAGPVRTFLAVLVACASPGLPPGGPPDSAAPLVRRITPDSNATNVSAKAILIHFDEVISERPGARVGASGGADLSALVLISPTDGRERVNWRRTAIEIEPRRGFRPNTTYRVTLLPGVSDLRGNVFGEKIEFVFSTGGEIPTGTITGVVFDWGTGRAAPFAQVEVFPGADSTVRWVARADSTGRFTVRDLAPGTYSVRGWVDANSDRRYDPREVFDSTTLGLADHGTVELYAFVRDTLTPRVDQVEVLDSTALRVRFDRGVAADWDPTGAVTLVDADSTRIPIGLMLPATRFDSLSRAAKDSTRADPVAVADTIAADSIAAADTVAADSTVRDVTPTDSVLADTAATDTVTVAAPVFGRAVPITNWVIRLDTPLAPGVYSLRIAGVRGLSGLARDNEREFRVRAPAPSAAADSTGVPPRPTADSTVVPPRPAADSSAARPRSKQSR